MKPPKQIIISATNSIKNIKVKKWRFYFFDFMFRYGIGALSIWGFLFFTKLGALTGFKIGSWLYLNELNIFGYNIINPPEPSSFDTLVSVADIFTYVMFILMLISWLSVKLYEIYRRRFVSEDFQFKLNIALRIPFATVFTISVAQMLVALMDANEMLPMLMNGKFGGNTIYIYLTFLPAAMAIATWYVFFRAKSRQSLLYASNFIQGVIAITMITSLLIIVNTGTFGINLQKALEYSSDDPDGLLGQLKNMTSSIYDFLNKFGEGIVNDFILMSEGILEELGMVGVDLGNHSDYAACSGIYGGTPGEWFSIDVIDNNILPWTSQDLDKGQVWGVNNNWQFSLIFLFLISGNILVFGAYAFVLKNKWSKKQWKPFFDINADLLGYMLFSFYIFGVVFYAFDQTIISNITNWNPNLYNGGLVKLASSNYFGTLYYWVIWSIVTLGVLVFIPIILYSGKLKKIIIKYMTIKELSTI